MNALELLLQIVLAIIGWPLRAFFRWIDRQPHRDPSQISTLHKIGRLALATAICLMILMHLGWLIFK